MYDSNEDARDEDCGYNNRVAGDIESCTMEAVVKSLSFELRKSINSYLKKTLEIGLKIPQGFIDQWNLILYNSIQKRIICVFLLQAKRVLLAET